MPEVKKPKILYVITQGAWGGAQRYVFDLAVNIAKNYDITIAVGEAKGKKGLQSKISDKIKIIQLNHLVRRISPFHDILAIFELRKFYKNKKPDIVHLNSSKAGIVGSLAKSLIKRQKTKIVYTAHGWVFNEPLSQFKKSLYKFLEKLTARWKDEIIVLSEQDKKIAIEKLKINSKKLKIIPIGINTPQNKLSKQEAQNKLLSKIHNPISKNQIWIGTIAGLYKTKGLDILIDAVNQLKNKKSTIKKLEFLILGDGPERTNLESTIKKYKTKNIHLLGHIENADQYLPAFDLFALPSKKEGLPYTILEAMANKTPIIATDVGGISTLIQDKKTGFLIKPEDSNILAQKILEVCELQQKTDKITENALLEVQKYTLESQAKKTTSLYQRLIQ